MKINGKYIFWAFWGVMAVVTALIYFRYDTNSDFIGLVENRTHILSVQESGRVARVNVVQGDQVRAGQVLLEMDTSDLDREKALLDAELERLQGHLDADRARAGLEYDKLSTQSESDSLNMEMKKADLAEKAAELESIRAEIERLQAAERAGLGRPRELSDLIIRRDTLAKVVAAQRAVLSDRPAPRDGRGGRADGARNQVVQSLIGDSLTRIGEVRVALALVESRRAMRTIASPADGRVVSLLNRPGDTVERYLPVVTVEEDRAEFVDVYMPETSGQTPVVGARVNLFPHRQMAADSTGVIVSVDPGYSVIPERLAFQGRFYWARKFRVQMDPAHQLMPGEAVRVELVDRTLGVGDAIAYALDKDASQAVGTVEGAGQAGGADRSGAVPAAPADRASATAQSTPATISCAPAAGFRGSFEPSGAVWLADIERYLIVSDDTGEKDTRHAPWIFLMDRAGVVEPAPVVLRGVAAVNDLEAATLAPDGTIYLVSSNNVNKKGLRKPVRQQILKVARDGRNFTVVASAALADAVIDAFDGKALAVIGLSANPSGAAMELNIEGAAFVDGALLLGLKQPVAQSGAIIWRLADVDGFLARGRLDHGQLSLFATVDLGVVEGRRAAISDLFAGADGMLFAASTVPGAPDSAQVGRVFRLEPAGAGAFSAVQLAQFPGLKPEAIAQAADGALTVLFDTGAAPARMATVGLGRP